MSPLITRSGKNQIGDSQLTIESLQCYKPLEIERRSLVSSGRSWRCSVRSVRADRLDTWVWEDICQVLSTPAIITEALRRASAGELLPTETSARVRQLQHARRTAQRQIERLVDAYTAEALTLDELQTRRAGLEERLRLLRQHEQELQRQHHQNLRLAELCANLETLCQTIRTGLDVLDFAGRRRIVELLVDRVRISHETVEIRYAIPLTGLGHTDKKGPLQLPYRSEFLSGYAGARTRQTAAAQVGSAAHGCALSPLGPSSPALE